VSKAETPQHGFTEISADERWHLVERILNSRELRRSARLRELLHYLGDQSIHRGIASIREQEIGEAVFSRTSNYDTSLDNIVRVNVTELRKRISLYFELEGSGEELLVEIPRGAYIPIFSRRPQPVVVAPEHTNVAPVEELQEAATSEPEALSRSNLRSERLLRAAILIAVIALCVATYFWRQNRTLRAQAYPWQTEPAMRDFWGAFFQSDAEVDIVTADTSLALAEDILQRPVPLDDYLDYKYKDVSALPGLSAETRQSLAQILNRNMGSVGDFQVAAEIIALEGRTHAAHLANARAYTPESIKSNNVILIGGPISNPWAGLYQGELDFYSQYDPVKHHSTFVNRHPQSGEQSAWEVQGEPNRGYSIVAFLPNLNTHHAALILAGSDSQATMAAGEWITSGEGLAWVRQKSPKGSFPYFEVLLDCSRLEGTPLQSTVRAWRIHTR